MRTPIAIALLASALGACNHTPEDNPARGMSAIHEPVVARSDYALDLAAPGGSVSPADAARLDVWFRSLQLGHGDSISVDGVYAESARADVARVAGNYGILLSPGAPVTAGRVPEDSVRVVVSRTRASVPGCPDWSHPAAPNYQNEQLPNYGCGVNANFAAMVANPTDLVYGREGSPVSDAETAVKAIELYREWPLTGITDGQAKRPLKEPILKKEK